MRTAYKWALTAALAALAFTAPGLMAQSQQKESLGEAARKARAQKKAPPKPVKVVTNEDVEAKPKFTGAIQMAPAPGEPAEAAQSGEQNAGAAPGEDQKGEKYWRQRFADAHAKLAQAEKELDILQREWEKGQTQYYPDPQKALKEQYNRKDLNEHAAKVEAKKKEIAQLKQGISDLEDELRRSGGDPGWSR